MNTIETAQIISTAGERLRFVPIDGTLAAAPLRLCVVVRPAEGEARSPFVLLRSAPDARVYLGAQVDQAGRVREWLEVWVQTISGLAGSLATQRGYISNRTLDEQWLRTAELFRESDGTGFIATGWEQQPPRPSYIDLEKSEIWHPVDPASGRPLAICRDDAVLRAAGLPEYTASLHRYATSAPTGEGSAGTLYPMTAQAPESAAVRPLASVLPAGRRLVPFNTEGGLLMVRRHAPLALDDYIDLLGGKPWRGTAAGGDAVRPGGLYEELDDWDRMQRGADYFFLGLQGRYGRFVEGFHLRLLLVRALVQLTRDAVARRQLPMLNLSQESFRVQLGQASPGLPALWAARMVPAQPGQAVGLPIKTSGVRHFLPLAAPAATIFRPEFLGLPTVGNGTVRIRRVFTDTADLTSVEGTVVTPERLRLTPHDVLWIKLPLSQGVTDLFGNLATSEGLAQGEARFRTLSQELPKPVARALREAEGSAFTATPFETIPMLSTPCDLYALGVLAVRTLLVNGNTSLPVALDEMLSLARQLGLVPAETGTPGERVQGLAEADSRWVASLGAHRLSHQAMTPEEAFAFLPDELWWETLATIARFFPGYGPDSYCRDFSDVSNFALEKVFDAPLGALDNLLVRSRGLLFSDWRANREMSAIIDSMR